MTAGTIKEPETGEIFTYCYLFGREEDKGQIEGIKDRPVVVIAKRGKRYIVAAVTTKGDNRPGAIPVPDDVASSAHLVPGSSVLVSEVNTFTWPGFDIRPLAKSNSYVTGRLTPGFFLKIANEIKARHGRHIERD
jgi:hypothetical protein